MNCSSVFIANLEDILPVGKIKWHINLIDSLKQSSHSMPPLIFWLFQGIQKWSIRLKWVKLFEQLKILKRKISIITTFVNYSYSERTFWNMGTSPKYWQFTHTLSLYWTLYIRFPICLQITSVIIDFQLPLSKPAISDPIPAFNASTVKQLSFSHLADAKPNL